MEIVVMKLEFMKTVQIGRSGDKISDHEDHVDRNSGDEFSGDEISNYEDSTDGDSDNDISDHENSADGESGEKPSDIVTDICKDESESPKSDISNRNSKYTDIYNDSDGIDSHMVTATTDDYIVEYDTRNYIAHAWSRSSSEYKTLTGKIKGLIPISMSQLHKRFPYPPGIQLHVLETKLPSKANKRINLIYLA